MIRRFKTIVSCQCAMYLFGPNFVHSFTRRIAEKAMNNVRKFEEFQHSSVGTVTPAQVVRVRRFELCRLCCFAGWSGQALLFHCCFRSREKRCPSCMTSLTKQNISMGGSFCSSCQQQVRRCTSALIPRQRFVHESNIFLRRVPLAFLCGHAAAKRATCNCAVRVAHASKRYTLSLVGDAAGCPLTNLLDINIATW